MIRLPCLILSVSLCLALALPRSCTAHAMQAGCQHIITAQGLELGIWYPSTGVDTRQVLGPYTQNCVAGGPVMGASHALIVISHGTGGAWTSHFDTALALARAGYIVVAPTEPGDNWRDTSHATDIAGRTRALGAAIDYMQRTWSEAERIDPRRIGAFGFSAGGLTVLLAAGARPELDRIGPWCARFPKSFTCSLIARTRSPVAGSLPSLRDYRLAAMAIAAPALGFTMTRKALADVTIPVQLWQAGDDRILPSPGSVEPVRNNLPTRPENHIVPHAGHFDFLAPCRPEAGMPTICSSETGFDRTGFHARLNSALIAFFDRTLPIKAPSGH